jgi:hypothetical protein
VKYCSDRCRHNKPGPVDRKIENTFVSLLESEEADTVNGDVHATKSPSSPSKPRRKAVKGDRRILVMCGAVEELVFGLHHDPEKVFGRRKNRASRALATADGEWKSVDMEDTDGSLEDRDSESSGVRVKNPKSTVGPVIRPPQTASEVNGSIGGEKGWAERKEETLEDVEKRKAGQRRAEAREMVRRAARRACAFGLKVNAPPNSAGDGVSTSRRTSSRAQRDEVNDADACEQLRKCKAVMSGTVVEASFAKGDWAIRWRE